VLDSVTMRTRSFVLRIPGDIAIRGLAQDLASDSFGPLLGRQVVVVGPVAYKPSGQPRRIDAEAMFAATAEDRLWARVPRVQSLARPSSVPTTDLTLVFGK
jgi:hypothetical protein